MDQVLFIHKYTVMFFSSEKFLVNIQIVLLIRTITVEILLEDCGVNQNIRATSTVKNFLNLKNLLNLQL